MSQYGFLKSVIKAYNIIEIKVRWCSFQCTSNHILVTLQKYIPSYALQLLAEWAQQEAEVCMDQGSISRQGSICVADILPNSPGWLSTYLKVLGTVHKLLLT